MRQIDAVVVGAGYAGLTAARALRRRGLEVVVLESRNRVGGRVVTERTATGEPVDLGGQWIGAGHRRWRALAHDYGAAIFRSPTAGVSSFLADDRVRRFRGDLPPIGPLRKGAVLLTMARLDRMAAGIDPRQPAATPAHRRWDARTVADWLRHLPPGHARRLIEQVISESLSAEVGEVSLLGLLTFIRAGGGLRGQLSMEGGALQDLFVDGADGPARSMAAELGDAVRLGTRVTAVHQDQQQARVITTDEEISCQRVVIAMAPPLAGRIAFSPPMPARRDQLTQRMPMGSILKMMAVYHRPFWRDDGLSGEISSPDGPVPAVFDVSRPGGPGLLCALVPAMAGQRLAVLSPGERRAVVLDRLARCLGSAALTPVEWKEKMWADDPDSRGGYGCYLPPGVLTAVGSAMREPVGRIHWAGSETATEWIGYVEGAVQSGERPAEEVLAAPTVLAPTPFHPSCCQPTSATCS